MTRLLSDATAFRAELIRAAQLLRDAGARGSDGYPPSKQRVREHATAAEAVIRAATRLGRQA